MINTAKKAVSADSHKVLVIQNTSLHERFGGIEYYIDDFCHLATETFGPSAVKSIIGLRQSKARKTLYETTLIHFRKGWWSKLDNRFSIPMLRAVLHSIRNNRPDYLICSHVSLGPLTFLASLLTNIPYITIVYGIECWDNLLPPDEWALRKAHAIVSISHWTKEVLTKRGYPPEKIAIVHPALDARFCGELVRHPKTTEICTLLTVSRLDSSEQYKGQDHVLLALDNLRKRNIATNLKYIIQGQGSDRIRLEGLVKELHLESQVEFRNQVTDRVELQNCYNNADIFIMPSRYGRWEGRWRGEGFGIVFLEASAWGLPLIAYDCGGATDIIQTNVNGLLVKPDDIRALADAIHYLATHPQVRSEMGKTATQIARERFSREKMKSAIVEAFKNLRS
ncbi:MAG: glycosyltransferase family 4 protein [Deltaproteobacteria bacterium]|nr:glycosyltransferase family 4 protein [Deltaproteobacteria bacterium]